MNNVLGMNNINTDHPEVLVHNVCVLRFFDLYCVIKKQAIWNTFGKTIRKGNTVSVPFLFFFSS